MQFSKAVEKLSEDSGVAPTICRDAFIRFLTRVSLPETERGGTGTAAFLAFKLHRFISGAGEIFTTLASRPRRVLFEGQLEDPEAPGNRLYPTRFCRTCGHEVHVVTRTDDSGEMLFLPRNIDDTPHDNPEGDIAGYLVPVGHDDQEYLFDGSIESFPEDWKEESKGVERLRSNRKERVPQRMTIGPDELPDWFLAFDVYDRNEARFWCTARRDKLATQLSLATVPKLLDGPASMEKLKKLVQEEPSRFRPGPLEGIVIRKEPSEWLQSRAKLVHPQFTQAITEHWSSRCLEWNRLVSSPLLPPS